ncbi:MAG: hypothetical protein RLZZ196_3220 [Bacteroidota bacterium]
MGFYLELNIKIFYKMTITKNIEAGNIDRRVSAENLSHYLFSQPHFFTNMEEYEVKDSDYFEIVSHLLPKDWSIQRREAWYIVKPDQTNIQRYGFKIHISLLSEFTKSALIKIVPIFIKNDLAFKFLVDIGMHDFFNSQACNKVSAGKFLTIYPPDLKTFKETLQNLYKVTQDFFGPFILSDRPYEDSKCLFYRFGSFVGNKQRNILGECNPVIINEENGDIDVRLPYYQLPKGISDPFEEIVYPEISILNNRYEVIDALASHSSKGSVYLAKDTKTNTKVVLKEARMFINRNYQSKKDAIIGLMHEENILKRLQGIGVTPSVIDSFDEWQHHFLVLEYIPFNILTYSNWQNHSILIKGTKHDLDVLYKKYLILLKNIIDTVEKIHQMGIIIGDIAPQNILFHPETLEVRFIDLEGAYDQRKEQFYSRITSRGFTTYYKDRQKKPTEIEDWCAVSALSIHLLIPICPLFAINPGAKQKYLEALVNSYGLPLEFIAIEEALRQNRVLDAKKTIEKLYDVLKDSKQKRLYTGIKLSTNRMNLPQILRKITNYIEYFVEHPMKSTIFPLDYHVFTTNRLSVAYGYLGVLYFLHKMASPLTKQLSSIILNKIQNEDLKNFPSGLYIGLSGIAWTLDECGLKTEALDLMKQVYNIKFKDESADLFYGASGWGLASLYFYEQTKSQQFLDYALEAAQKVDDKLIYQNNMPLLYQNIDGQYYSGLMYGNAGIALFFLRLFQSSHNQIYLEKAKCIMQSEINNGQIMGNEIVWRKNYKEKTTYPYFQFGSVGIGLVAIRFYLVLGDPYYLDLAKKIADSVIGKYCVYPGLFVGMAGIGIFFLDLYSATQHDNYLQEAYQVAHRIMLYQYSNDLGIVFPGDKLAALCTDYGTGSAGIGFFLHRLSRQGKGSELFLG